MTIRVSFADFMDLMFLVEKAGFEKAGVLMRLQWDREHNGTPNKQLQNAILDKEYCARYGPLPRTETLMAKLIKECTPDV